MLQVNSKLKELQFDPDSQVSLDEVVVNGLMELMLKVQHENKKWLLELYKSKFDEGCGQSTSLCWAKDDLSRLMNKAREDGVRLIQCVHESFQHLKRVNIDVPTESDIEKTLRYSGSPLALINGGIEPREGYSD